MSVLHASLVVLCYALVMMVCISARKTYWVEPEWAKQKISFFSRVYLSTTSVPDRSLLGELKCH